jgi:hypothetical protein
MKANPKLNLKATGCLLVSVILCGAVWSGRTQWWPVGRSIDSELAALTAEKESLAGCGDSAVSKLRQQVDARKIPNWTAVNLGQLKSHLGQDWECLLIPVTSQDERRITLSFRPKELNQWATCLRGIALVDKATGLILEGFDLEVQGAGSARAFTRIRLELRVRWAGAPGNKERGASLLPRSLLRGVSPAGPAAVVRLAGAARRAASGQPHHLAARPESI